ncbi:MAG TPA: hypothetical protein VLM40_22555 [Gemmata sp.]|nr:hypothetical protein [Gemmata sp.]
MPTEGHLGSAADSGGASSAAVETVPNAALNDVTEPSPITPGGGPAVLTAPEPDPAPHARKKKRRNRKHADVPIGRVIAPPPEPQAPQQSVPLAAAGTQPVAMLEVLAPPQLQPDAIPAPGSVSEAEEYEEPLDYGLAFALGALILVGPAVLASQLPFGRFIATALSVVGLLGGILALGTEGRARMMAIGATVAHSLILLVVFFIPSLLNLDPWLGYSTDEGPKGPVMIDHATSQKNAITSETWLDASKYSWEFRDVRVTVSSARVGPVELRGPKDAKRLTKEKYFQLELRLENSGVERMIDLSGWAAGQGADGVQLTDSAGKPLSPAKFDGAWQPELGNTARQLFPGHPSVVKFIYAPPPANTGPVRVELSGSAFGLPEQKVKFNCLAAVLARPTP